MRISLAAGLLTYAGYIYFDASNGSKGASESIDMLSSQGAAETTPATSIGDGVPASDTASRPIGRESTARVGERIENKQWYGAQIEQAYYGQNTKEALNAVHLLMRCRSSQELRNIVDREKSKGRLSTERIVRLIEISEEEIRQCQTVTPLMNSWESTLLRRVAVSGETGAASLYVRQVDFVLPADIKSEVVARLQADAKKGEVGALADVILHSDAFGLSKVERRAYIIAGEHKLTKSQRAWLQAIVQAAGQLSPEEEAAAQKLAQPIRDSIDKLG